MKQNEDLPIIVLGSKPNPILPDVSVKFVFAANGSVEAALPYRKKYNARIIGLVPAIELRKHTHIQNSIKKACPDKLIVFGNDLDIVSFVHDDLGLNKTKIELVNNKQRRALMNRSIGWRIILIALRRIRVRGFKNFLRKILPDILLNREKDWLMHSTGMDSIMYAMQNFPDKDVISAGIGLQQGSHFNGVGEFTSKTAMSDRDTVKHWLPSRRKHLYTTDDIMHSHGKVSLWRGKAI